MKLHIVYRIFEILYEFKRRDIHTHPLHREYTLNHTISENCILN